MKTSYAHDPLSLHPTTSSGRLYGDCNPSTVVLGVKGRRTEEAVGWRAPAFTIVELLIVIVVIGILAAISIAAYAGISQSARDSSAKASAKQLATKLETTYVQDGAYPSALSDIGIRTTDTTSYQYTSSPTTTPPSWCSTVTVGSTSYYVSNTTATPTKGGCPGHGQGGVEAITNLAINPRGTAYSTSSSSPTWWNDRWTTSGSYSLITGQASPSGTNITTAARYTASTISSNSLGFHIASNPEQETPGGIAKMMPVSAGETYTFSCYMRSSVDNVRFRISVRAATNVTTWTSAASSSALVTSSQGQWTRISQTYTVPAGATALAVFATTYGTTIPSGATIDATGLMVTQGSTLYNYADGLSTNWIWNGTANASTSTGPAL